MTSWLSLALLEIGAFKPLVRDEPKLPKSTESLANVHFVDFGNNGMCTNRPQQGRFKMPSQGSEIVRGLSPLRLE
jgi:hypothetical protein